jgi:hypothetical protein
MQPDYAGLICWLIVAPHTSAHKPLDYFDWILAGRAMVLERLFYKDNVASLGKLIWF